MSTQYLGFHFTVEPKEPATEILIAELAELEFESFVENEDGVSAFIQKELYQEGSLKDVYILQSDEFSIDYTIEEIDQVNWNEAWEKNFEPIEVEGICHVRAPFHEKSNAVYDLVIEPKMSFGTGHHETTHMMIQHLLETNVEGLKTLDMGCGTAVLAILAEMKGAHPIDAIDIDHWCYLNSLENIARNECQYITVEEGDAALLAGRSYDLIIANINRNILLNDMETYVACLRSNGLLLLSGFYVDDIPYLDKSCTEKGLELVKHKERNNWASLKYIKKR